MEPGEFHDSFALFDAKDHLVDWDEGFALEFRYAAHLLKPGRSYAEILRAAIDTPEAREFLLANYRVTDLSTLVAQRVRSLKTEQTREYRTSEGRVVRIDQHPTERGGTRRLARDITDECNAEDALAKARQQLDATDLDTQGVFVEIRRNPDGSYDFPPISDGLRRLLNFPPETAGFDAMMVHTRMQTSPGDDARLAAALEQSAKTLEICTMEHRVRDGKDQMRWLRQSMMPHRKADGTVIFSGVMRDVTREKAAEDQVALLQSVVVRSSDAMIIFETVGPPPGDTKILYINDKFTELFGETADMLVGQPMELLVSHDLGGRGSAAIGAARARDDGVPVEYETAGAGGRPFWVEARVESLQKFDDGRVRWAVISRDVTERHGAQIELLRAKEEAEAGSRAKTNFLANMSHELRTPLNAIIGFTDLIAASVARTGWTPAYTEYLGDVSGSGRHLLDLINTILDLSKIEVGSLALNIAPVDIRELLQASLAVVSGLARDGQIALSTQMPPNCPAIPGDFLKLKQVLINILSNAVKFTPPGGSITTTVAFSDDLAAITIADTGCGISESDLTRVMQPFVQAENSLARRAQGSGLGLSIAHEFCKLHGGSLEIGSIEGEGTTVRIALPRGTPGSVTQDSLF